ncbi:MAG: hypothetical protein AAF734_07645 [Bacteroidota bacterium]
MEHRESSSKKVVALRAKIKELAAALGRKQMKIDYLETMLSLAEEEYGIDLKKNSCTSPSQSSTKKK